MKAILLVLLVVLCAVLWTPARAIYVLELPEYGQLWVWSPEEMQQLRHDMKQLIKERDDWKDKAEAPRVCV